MKCNNCGKNDKQINKEIKRMEKQGIVSVGDFSVSNFCPTCGEFFCGSTNCVREGQGYDLLCTKCYTTLKKKYPSTKKKWWKF